MILLFFLMIAGYAFGAAGALLSPHDAAARRLTASGIVVGAAAGLAVALGLFTTGAPLAVEAPGFSTATA